MERVIVNCTTGQHTTIELTPKEVAEVIKRMAEYEAKDAENMAKMEYADKVAAELVEVAEERFAQKSIDPIDV